MNQHLPPFSGTVPPDVVSAPLARYLRRVFPEASARAVRAALDSGKVHVDGICTTDPGRPVRPGERLEVRPDAARSMIPGRVLRILFRDPHLVVVDKPSGLLSAPAANQKGPDGSGELRKLLDRLDKGRKDVFVVHRLDQGTSGVMLYARSEGATARLKELFGKHEIERAYEVFVQGKFPSDALTIRTFLSDDRGDGKKGSVPEDTPGAKEAITHIKFLESRGGVSRLSARLETGRTHQIRIHLSEEGFPVIADPIYAPNVPGPRLGLHARILGFVHPFTGEKLRFEVPPPDDLLAWWRMRTGSRS